MRPNLSWSNLAVVLPVLALYGGLYAWRWQSVRVEYGERGASVWRLAAFMGGLVLLFLALCSPVDALSEQLASMHMVQHLLLADLAPILLILALTRMLLRPVTRRVNSVERAAGPLAHPVMGVIVYVAAMWFWHIPYFYDAAYHHPPIHVLEHACFFMAGLLYWWFLLSPIRSRMRLGGIGPVLYMSSTKLLVGLLGILLTFAPAVLYSAYARGFDVWGLSPHDDQAVAGAVMALEQSIVMGIALIYLVVRAIGESERETQRAERLEDEREAQLERVELA